MDTTQWDNSPSLPVPLDVLFDILVHLPLQSILTLRRICRNLYAVTRLRALWALLFRTHVLDRHVPYPNLGAASLADLSAFQLESLTRRALALRRVWTSPNPVPRRHVTFNTYTEPSAHIIFLQFLPGRQNRWLISVSMTSRPRTYLLQCWDVASDQPRCVAELRHADGPYGGVVLNSDPTSSAVLAMQSAQTETFSINFDSEDPECGFETEATIDGIRELHLLSGSALVTRRVDDGGALSLWDLTDLRQEKLQLINPSLLQPDDRVQAIHLAHDYAIIVRVQSLEIYSTIPRPSLLPLRSAPIAYPLTRFRFQWPTDSVVLCEPHVSSSSHPMAPRPIHLLVRFGSTYPWPVNVLHHYVLSPNSMWGKRVRTPTRTPPPSPPPRVRLSPTSTTFPPPYTTEYDLPYDMRPSLLRTHTSPVRLFGQSAMALGQYGTVLWLDNHTEWLGPGERGQRLVGRMIQYDTLYGDRDVGRATTPPMVHTAQPGTDASSTSMVFGVRNDDAWTCIAMEEEAGRIALGHTDGAITLLEY